MNPVALAMSKRNDEKLLIDRVKKKKQYICTVMDL